MADLSQSNWSETDANNNSASPDGAPEGMAPSGVNDTIRALMGALKRFWNRLNGTVITSGADTVTAAFGAAAASYNTGERHLLKFGATNSITTPTLNLNSLGAKNIKDGSGNAFVVTGEQQSGQYGEFLYDGTNMRLLTLPWRAGTFTPTLSPGSGSITTQSGSGSYFRYGPMVWMVGGVTVTNAGTSAGSLNVTGLPYTVWNDTSAQGAVTIQATGFNLDTVSGDIVLQGRTVKNTTTILLDTLRDSASSGTAAGTGVTNSTSLVFSGFYLTASAF